MYKKILLIAFVVLAICSAIYALMEHRPVTTSSDKAYKAYQKGMEYMGKLYVQEALQEFEKAIKLDPQFAMAHLRAAVLYKEFDKVEKCEESKEKTLALLDKVKDIERLQILLAFAELDRKEKDIEKYSKELIERYPDNFDAVLFQSGKLFAEMKYEEAAEATLNLIKIDPEYALGYNQLGYIYFYLGDYDKSLEYLGKYAEVAEGQANPHDSKGEVLMNMGRYDEAMEEFLIADSIKPDLHFVVSHIGDCYASIGMHRDAIGAYMRAAELARNERLRAEQKVKIASCYYYMDRPDEAIAVLEEAVLSSADNATLHARLGSYYALTGNMDKALVQLGIVQGLIAGLWPAGDNADSTKRSIPPTQLYLEAQIASERGNYGDAINLLKQVLAQLQDYNSGYALRRLAEVYLKADLPDSAIASLDQVLKRNPNEALCLMYLAEAYQAKGMKKEQKDALGRFLSVAKDADQSVGLIREARAALSELEKELL